ncbi:MULTISPECIES: Ig-like domain-containing protein [unclassified Bradyrhizobium]|uniref:Ig-like domain-containing protein n=1 Tax=unclassified Bradyrhizobium TaxID=2631580 RepID=UPI002478ACF1|nr:MULTISPECIES: Ig-like domain-containing protein [unclassified Bradyrhizobium]WGR69258.1 Ig-like domain-containing protein [Bradyrhizobium sp. ISRA426]WGR81313.1 Ig-like domain-containing protein [Bradyrhizobium sp. ISRA430]WGR84497.1 Ig-like domain-containing protein [Bradyrhizobium sp. ISRA432]
MSETMVAATTAGAPVVTIGANFAGTNLLDFGANPPDTDGAVGPSQFVEFLNSDFRVYDKSGNVLQQSTLSDFWSSAGVPQPSPFDPRILFDPDSQRWYAAALDFTGAFLLAVSNTSDPAQGWQAVRIPIDPTGQSFGDFTRLGFNEDGVYLSATQIPVGPEPATSILVAIPKSDLLGPVPSTSNATVFANISHGEIGVVQQPAVAPELSGSEPILSAFNVDMPSTLLKVSSIDGLITSPTLDTANRAITVSPFQNPPGAIQKDTTVPINAADSSFTSSVVLQDGKLFGVHTISSDDNHSALQWFEIGTPLTNPVVLDTGLISPLGLDVYYGSIAVNPLGEVVIGFSGSGPNDFPSAYAVAGQLNGDVIQFGDPMLLQAGVAPQTSNSGRFGDYSATTFDPTDPSHFWTIEEWTSASDSVWSTQISEIIFGTTSPPVAHNDIAGVSKNHEVSGNVLTNDTDPNNEPLTVTAVAGATTNDAGEFVANGTFGTLVVDGDGTFTYDANKKIDFPDHGLAQDTFTYTATNTDQLSSEATLTVTVVKPGQTYIGGMPGTDADHLTVVTGGNGRQVIDGSLGFEQISGGNGRDVLVGGAGDLLTGGRGNDTFVFKNDFGANTITDFGKGHDTIQLDQSHFSNFAVVIANAASDGHEGTLITDPSHSGNTIDLLGVKVADLHANEFFFV